MSAVIIYENVFEQGTLSATDTASGFNVANICDYRPWTKWRANSAGTKYITVNFTASSRSVDCIGFIGHNFATAAATISVEYYDTGPGWVECVAGFTVSNNNAFIKTFNAVDAEELRVKIVTASVAPEVGVILGGSRLAFPYPPDGPYTPFEETISAVSEISRQGNFLGALINHTRRRISARWSWLTKTFVYTTFKAVWDAHLKDLKPFFFCWDISGNIADAYYVTLSPETVLNAPLTTNSIVEGISLTMEGQIE